MSIKTALIIKYLINILLIKMVENISKDTFEKYCNNSLSLKVLHNSIDGLWQLENRGIIFIAENYYSYITELHRNNFPEISDGFPQTLTDDMRIKIKTAKRLDQYIFEDYIYAFGDKYEQNVYLMGFNQIWFDCPQPICIDAGIDAITNSDSGNLMIFRGKYYWILKDDKSPDVFSAKLISNDYEEIPSHLDAVTRITDKQKTLFFKNNYIWIHSDNSNETVSKQRIVSLFQNGPNNINGALFINTEPKKSTIFLFRGIQYWAYDMSTGKSPPYQVLTGFPDFVTNLHNSFPNNIESCFVDQRSQKVVFFIRWMFFSFPIESLLQLNVEDSHLVRDYSFVKIFGCDPNDYKKWGFDSYKSFLKVYGNKSENFNQNNETFEINKTDITTIRSQNDSEYENASPEDGNKNETQEEFVNSNKNAIPLFLIIGIIVVFCSLSLLSYSTFMSKRQVNRNGKDYKENSDSGSIKKTKSLIRDMPSREVKSIVIGTNQLKPVDHQIFEWKSDIDPKKQNKTNIKRKPKVKRINQ